MPTAIKVTEETLPFIVKYAAAQQFNLSYVQYNLEEAHEMGVDLYVITDGTVERDNITYTTMIGPDFFRYWKFVQPMTPTAFGIIERV